MKYIDLFSGCGGFSLGIESSGFDLTFAVEKSPMAGETFYHNLIDSNIKYEDFLKLSIMEQLKIGLYIGEVGNLFKDQVLLDKIKNQFQNIDLIVGGPPCQGFSLAGKRNKDDIRNELPLQFLKYVEIFQPKIVLMENVGGINRCFKGCSTTPLEDIEKVLKNKNNEFNNGYEYVVQKLELNATNYNIPQNRKRIFLLAVRKDISIEKNIIIQNKIWKSLEYKKSDSFLSLCPIPKIINNNNKFNVIDALEGLIKNKPNKKENYLDLLNNKSGFKNIIKNNKSSLFLNHNPRKHSEKIINRFRLYQVFKDYNIKSKIFNKASEYNETLNIEIKNSILNNISNIKFPLYSNDNFFISKNIEEFFNLILSLSTKKHSQKVLDLNKSSPTVVSIPEDVIHPFEARVVTVREQARFQSFPDYFEFKSKETTGGKLRKVEVPQFTQVGNAVPPLLSKSLGDLIFNLLK